MTPDDRGSGPADDVSPPSVPNRLSYAGRPRPLPGDQMLMGAGCFASGVTTAIALLVLAIARNLQWLIAGEAANLACLALVGMGIGLRWRRWGFVQGIGIGVTALALLAGLTWTVFRRF